MQEKKEEAAISAARNCGEKTELGRENLAISHYTVGDRCTCVFGMVILLPGYDYRTLGGGEAEDVFGLLK